MSIVHYVFYGTFGMQNSMTPVILIFDPGKGQRQVKRDQISKLGIFLRKHANPVQSCLEISKMYLVHVKKQK